MGVNTIQVGDTWTEVSIIDGKTRTYEVTGKTEKDGSIIISSVEVGGAQ